MSFGPFEKVPAMFFARRGRAGVSAAAVAMARDFIDSVLRIEPEKDLVVAFAWHDSRRVREGGGPLVELGPGIDLVTYERSQLPDGVVMRAGELEFAIQIGPEILSATEFRLIDVDGSAEPPKLILR